MGIDMIFTGNWLYTLTVGILKVVYREGVFLAKSKQKGLLPSIVVKTGRNSKKSKRLLSAMTTNVFDVVLRAKTFIVKLVSHL